jgi:hypothetical protein
VHVDVDLLGRHVEEEEQRWRLLAPPLLAHGAVVGGEQRTVSQQAAVDEDEEPARAGAFGAADEAADLLAAAARGRHLDEVVGDGGAEELADALAGASLAGARWRRSDQRAPLVTQLEAHLGARQAVALHHLYRAAKLRRCGLQELAARRHVEEERGDFDGRSASARRRLGSEHAATLDADPPSGIARGAILARPLGRHQLDARDGGDGGEGLAAEAEGGDAQQVFELRDLAGGVAVEGEQRVVAPHATAVVGDDDAAAAAGVEVDGDRAGARVEGVLDQLLDHRSRALDHLAGRDLADQVIGKQANARGHAGTVTRRVEAVSGRSPIRGGRRPLLPVTSLGHVQPRRTK